MLQHTVTVRAETDNGNKLLQLFCNIHAICGAFVWHFRGNNGIHFSALGVIAFVNDQIESNMFYFWVWNLIITTKVPQQQQPVTTRLDKLIIPTSSIVCSKIFVVIAGDRGRLRMYT